MRAKLLFFFFLFSCGCNREIYRINDSQLGKIKTDRCSYIEIPLRETETINGKVYQHREWNCFLTVNNIEYFKNIRFKPGETISVPIPSGNVMIHLVLGSTVDDVSFIGPFKNPGIGGIDDIFLTVKPNQTIRLETIVPDKIIYGAAGGVGCLMAIPFPHPECYIKVGPYIKDNIGGLNP